MLHLITMPQEKARLVTDLKRLKQHFKAYEPTLKELERKYKVCYTAKSIFPDAIAGGLTTFHRGHTRGDRLNWDM